MKKTNKGFTIVELVIVIAVIAILAAVLIPTFTNLIERANMSVDEQLVKQMNTVLTADEIINGKPTTVVDAIEVLEANGITNIKANLAGNSFYWVGTDNRVLIWTVEGENGKVTYPEDYEGIATISANWALLANAEGPVEHEVIQITEATADALFAAFENENSETAVIQLPEGETVVLNGYEFYQAMSNASGNHKNITIDLNGGTLSAIETMSWSYSNGDKYENQPFGMVVPSGSELTIVNGKLDVPTPEKYTNAAGKEKSTGGSWPAFDVGSNASLVLRGVELTTDGAAIFPSGDASEVLIEGSVITSTGGYALGTNRSTSSNVKITVRNSTLECGTTAVFVNTKSFTMIENCTIIGGVHGVVVRAGEAKISNTTIKVTDTQPGIYSYKNFNRGAAGGNWYGGNAMPAAGITIGCYYNTAATYSGDAKVELYNVKIESPDTTILPDVVMAARFGDKLASLTYDSASSVGDVKIYGEDWIGAETTFTHAGTIKVNGETKTLN